MMKTSVCNPCMLLWGSGVVAECSTGWSIHCSCAGGGILWIHLLLKALCALGSLAQPCLWPLQKGFLWDCSAEGLILSSIKVVASSPGPASCFPGTELPIALTLGLLQDLRRPVLLVGPNLSVYHQLKWAELWFSYLGTVMSNFCCWGNIISRERVERDLLLKSGNGWIWKHLPMCTYGRAVSHKRLLF